VDNVVRNDPLVASFIDWANGWRHCLRDDVKVEIELGPLHEKRGAWMNFVDDTATGHIMVWNSGEYETLYRVIDSEAEPDYFYGNETGDTDFDRLFPSLWGISALTSNLVLVGETVGQFSVTYENRPPAQSGGLFVLVSN
jgi:hypothetical protein